jgi:hypothetical protein
MHMDRTEIAKFPPLRLPAAEIADNGKTRLGDSGITGAFPTLRLPDEKTADAGKVRLGDSGITGRFPPKR